MQPHPLLFRCTIRSRLTTGSPVAVITLVLASLLSFHPAATAQQGGAGGWGQLPGILHKIVAPRFPDRNFAVTSYGAKPGTQQDCLGAITRAIAACHAAGGGRVLIPAGTYFVKGPIHLLSNVNLVVEKGATLRFSTDPDDYLPLVLTRYEGMELMNFSPLIYAYKQKNIAVTGAGVLDGQASNDNWWNWTGSKRFGWKEGMGAQHDPANEPALVKMAAEGIPVKDRIFGKGHYMRPTFVEFYSCQNVLIQGVTIRNAPFWLLHPTLCTNVTVDGVTTESLGPNNDGCDPESCDGVWIKNCSFRDGDDCIAIKSGRNEDGRRINVPSRNIVVEDCEMADGHGGVVIGSETSGGVENVFVQRCRMDSKNLDRAIRIKSNACRGGVLKNFYFRRIKVGQVREAVIRINMFYGGPKVGGCGFTPTLDGVYIDEVQSEKSTYAVYIEGRSDKPVSNIHITDCDFNNVQKPNLIKDATDFHITGTRINGNKADQ
jgi:polygalacturonase